ncbi:MAG: hypothetical protein ACK5HM_08270 [Gemmatimonas sp.]|jgi:hypothetical protein|nr:hypothetical protein [Gemmatimonas sp.]MCZ8012016.1 hypothetical protein [Gemmatimonas sp.]MCZ8267335.1 hypothetical protein [Gemmatimonas sp.]
MPTRSTHLRSAVGGIHSRSPEPFRVAIDEVYHEIFLSTERPFTEQEIAALREDEEDPRNVATAETLVLDVKIDGNARYTSISRGYQRNGAWQPYTETRQLMLDADSWTQFVALVNMADNRLKELATHMPGITLSSSAPSEAKQCGR